MIGSRHTAAVVAGVALGALAFWSWRRRHAPAARPVEPVATAAADAMSGAAAAPTRGLSHAFDAIFAQHGRGIPVAYLRALGHAESGLRPNDPHGLINVVAVALADYNRRHREAPLRAAQLRDPIVSVTVAADILRTVIASYARHHPAVVNLREDWSNPHFVSLVTAGWLCARAHNQPYAKCGVMRPRSACSPLLVGREQSDAERRSHNA